ncbi:MAG: 4'-phosphopantetheinyl transferase superfamily protein [Ginsengibacter sp.]
MPLFYQHNINHNTKLAIWHIAEPEDFFLRKVPLQNTITHWHKRLQHLAGRYLLQELHPDFPYHLIEIADTRKPFLQNEKYHFSISHCADYAAVIVSEEKRVGIDIELITPKIELIKHKFLSEEEIGLVSGQWSMVNREIQLLTLLWSCKEAVFKWYGNGGVDFKKNIIIKKISMNDDDGIVDCLFTKEDETQLQIQYHFFDNISLAWII